MTDEDCVFCDVVDGERPSYPIRRDDGAMAFLSTGGANPSHTLVVPTDHATTLTEMSDEQIHSVFTTARDVADALWNAVDPDGVNLYQANGYNQDIYHVHVHVVPKFDGDGKVHATVTEDGYVPTWETEDFTDDQLRHAQERIRDHGF